MNYDYIDWLTLELVKLQNELSLSDYKIYVEEEQMFVKRKSLEDNSIFVVIKYLSSSLQSGAETKPVQIMILSEKNGLDNVKILFNRFAEKYNWTNVISGTEYIKHQYSTPIVMSNFNEVSYGYRSILYMSGMLFVMKDVLDIKELKVDNNLITPISFNIVYSMSANTQQLPNDFIASSVKNSSSFSVSLVVPLTNTALPNKVLNIIKEVGTGNENFNFKITLTNNAVIEKNLKLTSTQIITSVNQVPSLQLTFMR